MTKLEALKTIFNLYWSPFAEGDWLAFAGAVEEAHIATDAMGNTWVRSIEDGRMAVECVAIDGTPMMGCTIEMDEY